MKKCVFVSREPCVLYSRIPPLVLYVSISSALLPHAVAVLAAVALLLLLLLLLLGVADLAHALLLAREEADELVVPGMRSTGGVRELKHTRLGKI